MDFKKTNGHQPLVNNGSGSFLKKDLSKLLMTLRSLHFWKDTRKKSDYPTSRFVAGVEATGGGRGRVSFNDAVATETHVVVDVDVVHALVVELFLHVGDGGVVPGDSVDARVLQTPLLHQLTADLHDQRHKLETKKQKKRNKEE